MVRSCLHAQSSIDERRLGHEHRAIIIDIIHADLTTYVELHYFKSQLISLTVIFGRNGHLVSDIKT